MKATTLSTLFMIGAFLACPSLRGAAPYAHTQTPGPVSAANATLHGMVTPNGEPTTAWFEWGPPNNLTSQTPGILLDPATDVVRVSETIDGLEPGGQYEFRVVVSNRFGVTPARVRRFTTGGRISTWGQSWFGPVLPPPNLPCWPMTVNSTRSKRKSR